MCPTISQSDMCDVETEPSKTQHGLLPPQLEQMHTVSRNVQK